MDLSLNIGVEYYSSALLGFVLSLIAFYVWRSKSALSNEDIRLEVKNSEKEITNEVESSMFPIIKLFYGSHSGTAKRFAETLVDELTQLHFQAELTDLTNYDPDELPTEVQEYGKSKVYVFLLSTYSEGKPPPSSSWFYKWLHDTVTDFRLHKSLLKGMNYAIFGLGDTSYGKDFNRVARHVDRWLIKLNAFKIMPLSLGDDDSSASKNGGLQGDFGMWKKEFLAKLQYAASTGSYEKSANLESDEAFIETSSDDDDSGSEGGLVDVEDLAITRQNRRAFPKKDNKSDVDIKKKRDTKEMITPALREALTKQGYHLVGTHSGVKLCRWTKSMLRGRGGCYKHTFYGIESHRCMETTPSLACANKCVFCWRHHSNPVGTEWKWKMDKAEDVFQQALDGHYQMIKQFRGVPGVQPERMKEAMKVQHCALSLVGEPIMYPEINKFVKLLHSQQISSFLVTNAQFPDAIRNLSPVTQMYVSVDASTKESLKKIDRPLFRDFWPRFLDSLRALSEKGQRTVYRLTLVKDYNVKSIEEYAVLVSLGKPDFIEVKGVTYCGTSKGSHLTMENVPWHKEVVGFVEKLAESLGDYEIASEHEHSNCILLAHKKFKIEGKWHTWIDYAKFHELVQEFDQSGGVKNFSSLDYMTPTPSWACYGSQEQGFDPNETRWFRKNRKDISGC
ncbi:S-adenosyl-L-methionine-dependent tRNA 4-demethylwyosine synthase [Chamberlinius hualienensis]